MKATALLIIIAVILISCNTGRDNATDSTHSNSIPLTGTWKLINGTLIEKGDTTFTEYTKNTSFIKIINDTHFAFLLHDLNKGKDSTATFTAGGGKYTLKDSTYTEHLEYCSAREWEDHDFTFTMTIRNDTLIQRGIEKIESEGIERLNIEKYVRLNK